MPSALRAAASAWFATRLAAAVTALLFDIPRTIPLMICRPTSTAALPLLVAILARAVRICPPDEVMAAADCEPMLRNAVTIRAEAAVTAVAVF